MGDTPHRSALARLRGGTLWLALGAACAPAAVAPPPELAAGVDGIVADGAETRLGGTALLLRVERIVDSRCPVDVTCVTAGDALVAISLSGDGAVRRDTLRTAGEPRSVSYGGVTVTLVAVIPEPRSTEPGRARSAVLRAVSGP